MTTHTDGHAPKGEKGLALHLQMTAFTGTASHLAERHDVDPSKVDRDDPHGLAADHARLHGLDVTATGNLRAVP